MSLLTGRPVLVLRGPNLNLLGRREPAVYGRVTLAQVNRAIERHAASRGASAACRQSNHEGQHVDWIQGAADQGFGAIVINPGALTHYSIALRDAFVAVGQVSGFGLTSYLLRVDAPLEVQVSIGDGGSERPSPGARPGSWARTSAGRRSTSPRYTACAISSASSASSRVGPSGSPG